MELFQKTASLFILANLFACSTAVEKAQNITVKNSDPPSKCERVGSVVASPMKEGEKKDDIQKRLEERAMAKGGNYVKLETLDAKGGMTGMAFRCP
jgi:hypothetical protein